MTCCPRVGTEVAAFWKCIRWTLKFAPPRAQPVFLNLDETCIGFGAGSSKGLVAHPLELPTSANAEPGPTALRQSRAALTHVAIIADDTALQPRLPQVLIVGRRTCTQRVVAIARHSCPANVHILHEQSSWNTSATMMRILDLIGEAVKSCGPATFPILLLDCAPQHLHRDLCTKARSNGIALIFVPAQCTSLLQPLDTHAFFGYKACLRRLRQQLEQERMGGVVEQAAWLQALACEASSYFCRRRWQRAFQSVGACRCPLSHAQLSGSLQTQLGEAVHSLVSEGRPSENELQALFPRRRQRPHSSWFLPGAPRCRMRRKMPWPDG